MRSSSRRENWVRMPDVLFYVYVFFFFCFVVVFRVGHIEAENSPRINYFGYIVDGFSV